MSDTPVSGRCYCGRIQFRLLGKPRFVAHCHCENCRRAHGAGVVTWAGFLLEDLRIDAGASELSSYRTETEAIRSFCRNCGSPLFFESPRWEGELHVAVAGLTEPLERLPSGHAYADRSPPWCPITDDLPRYGGTTGTEPLLKD